MRPALRIDVAAPAEQAWRELVDLDSWPHWGPTVRGARLDDGTRRLSAGSTGAVQTSVGLWLPFEVDGWHEDAERRSWSWRVAAVHATEHTVVSTGASTCRVEMNVPWPAAPYLGVVGLALMRIRTRVEAGD
jgi:hypothetical protein